MIKIHVHNHKCQMYGDALLINEIRETPQFRIRVKGFYFAVMKGATGWDGYKRFISERGLFGTGLLPEVIEWFSKNNIDVELVDKRNLFKEKYEVDKLGDLELRDYQAEAVNAFLSNKIGTMRFQRGVLWEATNSGKNLIAAAIYSSYHSKRQALFLINNIVIFNQAIEELSELLGKDVVGQVGSKKTDWKKFNVCMVQTLSNRIKSDPKIRASVAATDIMLIDESDEVIARKDTQHILSTAHNCPIRLGLTGTEGMSKDKIRNKQSVEILGPVIHRTRNKELVDKGHSAKPTIKIHWGNTTVRYNNDYQAEYEDGIIKNKERNKKVWKRVKYHVSKGRKHILILFKYHRHVKYLEKYCPEELKDKLRIVYVHHKTPDREGKLKNFNDGKIDVLVCSMIIRRGKNAPIMQALINAAGGDSQSNLLQIFGRGIRKKSKGKNEIHIDDFRDIGKYLQRHSKHRIIYYKNEGFPVKELYKNKPQ